jgi:hypothetical protein
VATGVCEYDGVSARHVPEKPFMPETTSAPARLPRALPAPKVS